MQIEGLHVRVDKASERRASKKDDAGVFYHPGRTLFVGNLPFDATVSHQRDSLAPACIPSDLLRSICKLARRACGAGCHHFQAQMKPTSKTMPHGILVLINLHAFAWSLLQWMVLLQRVLFQGFQSESALFVGLGCLEQHSQGLDRACAYVWRHMDCILTGAVSPCCLSAYFSAPGL